MKISIAIIGHNEVNHLSEMLPQLDWADEVIYVDCDSEDQSLDVAKKNGCQVFKRPNNPNLNVNKSYAFDQATGDWIFYLDTDERIPSALATEIRQKVESPSKHSAFELNRRNHYFGKWLKHGSQYPDTQLRLFRKGNAHFENKHVHEKLQVNGSIGKLKEDMYHFPYLTISQFLKKFDFYTSFEASHLQEIGITLSWNNHFRYLLFTPSNRFIRRYFFKLGYLDGFAGFFCCLFDALNVMVRYFKLWEIQQKNES